MKSIKISLRNAIIKSASGKIGLYIFQFISIVVLSRILMPEDYGIYSGIFAIYLLFQILGEGGISPSIIYTNKFKEKTKNILFGNVITISTVVTIIFFYSSFYFFDFYSFDTKYVNEHTMLFSISLFLSTITIVPLSFFSIDKKFLEIAWFETISEITSLIAILSITYIYIGELLLTIKLAIYNAIRFITLYIYSNRTSNKRPKPSFSGFVMRKYWEYTKHQLLHSLITYITRNIDTIVVAKLFGSITVGYYDRAYQLMRYPLLLLAFTLAPAIQPVLIGTDKNSNQVYESICYMLKILFLTSGLISIMMLINAEYIINIILGSGWNETAIYLMIFSIGIAPQVVVGISGGIFQAYNEGKLQVKSSLSCAVCIVISITIGIFTSNITYLISAITISFYIYMYVCYKYIFEKIFRKNKFEFIKTTQYLIAPSFTAFMITNHIADQLNLYGVRLVIANSISSIIVFIIFLKIIGLNAIRKKSNEK